MKCTFCGNEIKPGTGKMFVMNTGNVNYFCSNKCEKNQFKLGRVSRDLKWTQHYEKTAKSSK